MLFPIDTLTRSLKPLDGLWNLAYDPKHLGEKNEWFKSFPKDSIEVAVPASINEQIVDRDKYNYMDWVWYEKSFYAPIEWKSNKRIFLRIGSANYRATVYLNGIKLGAHEGGYTPFEFEINKNIYFEKANTLVVKVDNLLNETSIPQGMLGSSNGGVTSWRVNNYPEVHYDFFPFTGIHRPVNLYTTNESRIETIKLLTEKLNGTIANINANISTSGPANKLKIKCTELNYEKTVDLNRNLAQNIKIELSNIVSWSPESPKLYNFEFFLESNQHTIDHYELPFGIRTINVSQEKLLLNGKPIELKGFGKHEDLNVIGKGLNLPYMVKDNELMKWIGANSYRTSHYPYAEEMMRMADKHGVLVIDETPANTLSMLSVKDKTIRKTLSNNHKKQVLELIERDYNYACVISWSLGNECETYLEEGKGYFRDIVKYAKTLDQSRPITFVINSKPDEELEADSFDIIMLNTYPAWYQRPGRLDMVEDLLSKQVEGFWHKYKKPIILTEFGADTIPGLHSDISLMWSEEFQVDLLNLILDYCDKTPYVIGAHIWNFADFKVCQHTTRIILNWKGLFTRDRTPKMAAHIVKSRWKDSNKRF